MPTSNELAVDRTRLAHERTLMAWTRTATSLISFGFTIYKFFQYVHEENRAMNEGGGVIGPRHFALFMISTGIIALVLATLEHRRSMRSLRASYGSLPYSLATVVASLVALLGVLGIIAVLLNR
jgi:putative membrane protein